MTSDGERSPAFEVASQVLMELADADLFGFHIAYSVYTVTHSRTDRPKVLGDGVSVRRTDRERLVIRVTF